MKSFATVLGFLAMTACGAVENPCLKIDPSLVKCPSPRAPRVTELKPGKIELLISIDRQGQVTGAAVQAVEGDPRWETAALDAVAKWQFKKGAERSLVQKFDFVNE